jgi:hypothetical protein
MFMWMEIPETGQIMGPFSHRNRNVRFCVAKNTEMEGSISVTKINQK